MTSDLANDDRQIIVIGKDCATVAVAAEWLRGEKAGAGDRGDSATANTVLCCSEALRGIFTTGISCHAAIALIRSKSGI